VNGSSLVRFARACLHRLLVATGAFGLTLAFFLVLPLMETIGQTAEADLIVQSVDTADLPPPPPPIEEEPEQEEQPEEQPPELTEQAEPLDLSQLELALNPGLGDGWLGGDFAVNLGTVAQAASGEVEELFSIADLDQKPRVLYQPSPVLDAKVRKKAPGTVYVLFVVDQRGRVENPIVQQATDPVFEAPALAAVKQWKFEPGKRNGQPVRFRMRVPITFPQS
jgi:protein TonB